MWILQGPQLHAWRSKNDTVTPRRVKLACKSVPRAQQGWCGAPRQALQELRRGGAIFLLSRSTSRPPWVSLLPQAVVCSSLRGSGSWKGLQSPRALAHRACSVTKQPFRSCSSFQAHVGNVGHRQNGFHGNSHFRDASEKICVGGKIFCFNFTLQRKDGRGLQQHPRNGGVKISRWFWFCRARLFPAWAGCGICPIQ